ncbi:hypothetical protein MA16_Dca000403 [Dendrobium catenatum]|uniref:Uncharacterized protein n=1 Tax=Dendrobium catenatum TaxID=906689 RepID=A0A2I0WTR9_9ASPA|nr:hypothetical protein MA16_Dca000403 [Dendrobium catenatum]
MAKLYEAKTTPKDLNKNTLGCGRPTSSYSSFGGLSSSPSLVAPLAPPGLSSNVYSQNKHFHKRNLTSWILRCYSTLLIRRRPLRLRSFDDVPFLSDRKLGHLNKSNHGSSLVVTEVTFSLFASFCSITKLTRCEDEYAMNKASGATPKLKEGEASSKIQACVLLAEDGLIPDDRNVKANEMVFNMVMRPEHP